MKKHLLNLVVYLGVFLLGAGGHKLYSTHHHPLKHTWECQLVQQPTHGVFWFMRPNGEIFEMYFDNPPILRVGMTLRDVAYTDDNADMRHFVRATMK